MLSWDEIEEKRKALGLSRAELCRRAGISESTVFKGLHKHTPPSSVVAEAIGRVLDSAKERQERAA